MSDSIILEIEYNDEYVEVEVEYNTYPSYRGARDRFGVQLEPDEDGGVEIVSVINLETKTEIEDVDDRYIKDKIIEILSEDCEDYDDYDYED